METRFGYHSNVECIEMHARCQAPSKKSLEVVNGSNCIDPGFSSHSHIDKKIAQDSGGIISKVVVRILGNLTPME